MPRPGPGIPPDIVNCAFDGDDVEAVLRKGNFKAGVHRTELVNILEMSSAPIKDVSLFVHEALESRLHERGRSQDRFGPIRLTNSDGETARGEPEGNARCGRWSTGGAVRKAQRWSERFEAIGERAGPTPR